MRDSGAGAKAELKVASDLADYLLDYYGTCDRDEDCYWGKDQLGRPNGCLNVGWKGRGCPHWKPLGATTYEELKQMVFTSVEGSK